LTWILAYEKGNGRNTKAIQKSLNYLLSDKAQAKAPSLGFVPLKGEILKKSRAAVKRIGR
jgi:phosphate transport system substrate-binding protein